jgi:hypothetical protein
MRGESCDCWHLLLNPCQPNLTSFMKRNSFILRTSALTPFVLWTASAFAGPFVYNSRDLLLGFRNSSAATDFVVDVGPASMYYGGSGTFTIGSFTGAQLNSVFGSMNSLSFSVFGDVRSSGDASYPLNTLWVTSPRVDPNTQNNPWNRQSQFSQGNTGSKIDGIASGALAYSGTIPADSNNTSSTVNVPRTWNAGGVSYTLGIGASGNFANAFQGGVENTTAADFATSGGVVRSDLYELKPGTGQGSYLGYFELSNSGTMTFTVVPEPETWTLLALASGFVLVQNRRFFRRVS